MTVRAVDVITIIASAFQILQVSIQYSHQQQRVVRFVRFENDSTQGNSNAVKPLDLATVLQHDIPLTRTSLSWSALAGVSPRACRSLPPARFQLGLPPLLELVIES